MEGIWVPNIKIHKIPIKGGMTIPNIRSLDPGTYDDINLVLSFVHFPRSPCSASCGTGHQAVVCRVCQGELAEGVLFCKHLVKGCKGNPPLNWPYFCESGGWCNMRFHQDTHYPL